jgi:hypothetical protein
MPESLLIVKTNLDWDRKFASTLSEEQLLRYDRDPDLGPLRRLDILGEHFDDPTYGYGKMLEERLQIYGKNSLKPCIELRPAYAILHSNPHLSSISANFPVHEIKNWGDLLRMKHRRLDSSFKRFCPPMFDLLIDFVSNRGQYDYLQKTLEKEFDLRYVEIKWAQS